MFCFVKMTTKGITFIWHQCIPFLAKNGQSWQQCEACPLCTAKSHSSSQQLLSNTNKFLCSFLLMCPTAKRLPLPYPPFSWSASWRACSAQASVVLQCLGGHSGCDVIFKTSFSLSIEMFLTSLNCFQSRQKCRNSSQCFYFLYRNASYFAEEDVLG